jgi:hypothetical protein
MKSRRRSNQIRQGSAAMGDRMRAPTVRRRNGPSISGKRSAKAEAKKDKPAASRDRERAMNPEVASGTISSAFD